MLKSNVNFFKRQFRVLIGNNRCEYKDSVAFTKSIAKLEKNTDFDYNLSAKKTI